MKTLYVSHQGCRLSLHHEHVCLSHEGITLQEVQLPLVDQILIFGQSQITTQVIRACLQREIPIAYLSRSGYCYGRIMPVKSGHRHLAFRQQQLSGSHQLAIAKSIVEAKLLNGRVLLMRQKRTQDGDLLPIESLKYLAHRLDQAESIEQVRGIEGAGAATYFPALGSYLRKPDFILIHRTKRPPQNPVNALLSFGYQVLWNHLLTLIELHHLDPYQGYLHASSERHAALVSDLLEEFRSPIIDSLMLWLVNTGVMKCDTDFEYQDQGCYLNESGRKKFLRAFIQRMEGNIQGDNHQDQPRWDVLNQQVRRLKQMIYNPEKVYQPYRIR